MLREIIETSTTTATETRFSVRKILYITNDGHHDIRFNLDTPLDRWSKPSFGVLLKPGETISGLDDLSVDYINHISYGGDSTIRVGGIENGAY